MRRCFFLLLSLFLVGSAALPALATEATVLAMKPPQLIIGFDPNFPPYQFVENGRVVGAHADILDQLADDLGFEIFYFPMSDTDTALRALQAQQVDMVLGTVYGNDYSEFEAATTQSISHSMVCMIAGVENARLIFEDKRPIAAVYQDGTVNFSFISTLGSIQTIPVSNQVRVFNQLIGGGAQAAIGIQGSLDYQLARAKLTDSYTVVNNYMLPVDFSIAVRSKDQDLLKKLNAGLYQQRVSGDYEKILNKWIENENTKWQTLFQNAIKLVALAAIVVLSVFYFNVHINRLLKKQVVEKTKELQWKNEELERKITETRNSTELINSVVENNPSAIVVFDDELNITLCNDSAKKLFFSPDFAIGKKISQSPMLQTMLEDRLDILMQSNAPQFVRWEVSFKTPAGQETYRASLYPLYNDAATGGSVRGATLTIREITKERQMQEQAFERVKNLALNRMVAGIAHEIRNPLMAIRTYTSLLPSKLGNREFQSQMARFVPQEVDRVNALVTSLIDYAKPRTLNKEEFMSDEVVEFCVMLIEPTLKSKGITLTLDLKRDMTLFCDCAQLKQVLINILLNSIEAIEKKQNDMPEAVVESTIKVASWEDDTHRTIQITDSGIGMTEEELRFATEAFYTTKQYGTGLGLALSKQFVDDNDGEMLVESQKNCYTKVTLRFERNRHETENLGC